MRGNLSDGRDHHGQKSDVGNEIAGRHFARENISRAEIHHGRRDDSHQRRGGKAHQGGGGECLKNVIEQFLDADAEDFLFPFLGVVALDDAHAAERFGEPAGDFGIEFWPRAIHGPDFFERLAEPEPEDQDSDEGGHRHRDAHAKQVGEGDDRRHDAADKIHQTRADEIPDAFDVAHDSRDEDSGFVRIVEGHRQTADVRLHLDAQFGDHSLRGFREQLRERVGRQSLHNGRA